MPVQVKKNPGLGFSIAGGVAGAETGIIVTKVNPDGPAQGTLRPGDKILEVDGIDFTKSDHNNAVAVLRATGAVVSMMISRHQWHPVKKRNDIFFLFSVTSDQFIHIKLNTLH